MNDSMFFNQVFKFLGTPIFWMCSLGILFGFMLVVHVIQSIIRRGTGEKTELELLLDWIFKKAHK